MTLVLEDFALRKLAKKGVIHKIGIVGCGAMGQEIARLVSHSGLDVVFVDIHHERVQVIFENLNNQLDQVISQWGLTEGEKRAILSRITGTTDYKDLAGCDIVIETINSRKPGTSLELRKEVFTKIEEAVSKETIIASNTSTLIISELASVLKHPERALGLHFLAPVSEVKIVEAVRGINTSKEAMETIIRFAKMIEKKVIPIHESPGNISTRLIVTLINEACETLMEGVSAVECIDETMKQGFGMQFGPFELADRIGLDKVLKWMENLYKEYGQQKFFPSPIIRKLARSNYLGRKTSRGFYIYENGKKIGQTITATSIK